MEDSAPLELLPTPREIYNRLHRQRLVFFVVFLLVVAAFVVTGQFRPKYKADMKLLVSRERVDPIVTTAPTSTPQLQGLAVTDEDLNSEVELLKGDDILSQVVLKAGIVPAGTTNRVTIAKAVRKLQRKLDVSVITKTDLIGITYESPNPSQSQAVLTAIEQLYPAKQRGIHANNDQVSFFSQQVAQQAAALQDAQNKLTAFTQQTGVISADLQRDLTVRQIADTNAVRQQTDAEIANLQGRALNLAGQLKDQQPRILTETRSSDNPALLQQLKTSLLTLQLKRTELLNKYDPHYRLVQDVDREIATNQALIDQQATAKVAETSDNINPVYQTLVSDLADTEAQLAGLQDKRSQLNRSSSSLQDSAESFASQNAQQQLLLANVKTAQDQYQLYVDKLAQAQMTQSLDREGILNVRVAQEPTYPALPQNSLLSTLAAMFFTGLILGAGIAFLFDLFKPAVEPILVERPVA
jgi:succinoglycan biosynthesis transport protein ExoP